jgi:hypothetical protein
VTHGLCLGHLPVRTDDEPRHRATGRSPTREIVNPVLNRFAGNRIESTVHYRGIEVDDALIMSGQVEL